MQSMETFTEWGLNKVTWIKLIYINKEFRIS